MLEQSNQLPALAKLDDYGETVYTTWRMCYDQLKPQSRQILWLVSYLHYAHVSEDIFKWAAQQMNSYEDPLPLNQLESSAHSHVKDCLSSFLDSDGCWDTVKFTNVMADLRSYSLVTFDQLNLTYVVHVLVQDWARTMIPQETELAFECTVTLVSLSIRWEKDTESLAFKRGLGPHVTRLLEHRSIIGANHARRFSAVCYSTGQWSQKEKLELQVLETFKQRLGEKHPATLVVMGDLGSTYSYQKQWKKAENYAAQALDATKEVLGEEHTETLRGMEALAIIYMYSDLDKWNEAERLLIRALDAHRRILSEDHPDTLNTMANLAHAHSRTGQWSEAEKLRSRVVKGRKQVLGEEHPKTLSSMLGLAQVYSHMDRWDEATSLLTTTLNISRLQLGDEHPHTQRCARHLAKVKIHQPV
jgi:tetratricopeptide (TPR) repeat protein